MSNFFKRTTFLFRIQLLTVKSDLSFPHNKRTNRLKLVCCARLQEQLSNLKGPAYSVSLIHEAIRWKPHHFVLSFIHPFSTQGPGLFPHKRIRKVVCGWSEVCGHACLRGKALRQQCRHFDSTAPLPEVVRARNSLEELLAEAVRKVQHSLWQICGLTVDADADTEWRPWQEENPIPWRIL